MFGSKHDDELRRTGSRATARVIAVHTSWLVSTPTGAGSAATESSATQACKVTLRVQPEGAPEFDAEVKARLELWRQPAAGDSVAVIYDPADHDRVMLDGDAQPPGQAAAGGQTAYSAPPGLPPASGPGASEPGAGTPGASGPGAGAAGRLAELESLADLRDRGVLTDAEFAAEKRRILGEA